MDMHATERMATRIAEMDRDRLIVLLQEMHCTFPLDFTREFLDSLSLEKLRHIAFSASLHQAHKAVA
jgi:hypothetical protein